MKNKPPIISFVAAIITILLGMMVIVGWFTHNDFLRMLVPGQVKMKFNVASGFVLSSIALLLNYSSGKNKIRHRISVLLSVIVSLIGLLTLIEYAFGFNLGIDELFVKDELRTTAIYYAGRMSPLAATNFLLIGTGLLLLNKERTVVYQFYYLSGIAFIALLMLICFNFITDIPTYIRLAIHVAIGFITLPTAIWLAQPALHKKISFERKLFTGFTAAIILIAVLSIFSSYYSNKLISTSQLVEHVQQQMENNKSIVSFQRAFVVLLASILILLVIILFSIRNNITIRKKVEKQNKENEEQIQVIFDAAPDAVIVINAEGKIVKWNPKSTTLFGWTAAEVMGKPLSQIIIPPRYRDAHQKGLQHFLETGNGPVLGHTIEIQALNKNNIEFDIALSISPTIANGNHLFIGFVSDITDRKKAEARLKESEEKYSTLFNSIDEGFCIIEMIFDEHKKPVDYRFLVINASFERQTGLRDAVGKRMREFAPNHEEHWFETYGRIALTGESIRFENRAEQLNRWYDVYAFPFGEPKNFQVAILFNDISERKKTEKELEAVNKELEAFSYSVSHDLRAPLRAIIAFTTILEEDYASKLDDEAKRIATVIKTNTLKMGNLIDDLLAFSRMGKQEIAKTTVNTGEMVKEVTNELTQSNKAPCIIEWDIQTLPSINADINTIRQVWINLISNAIKYSGKSIPPRIEIGSFKKEGQVVFFVKDNGVGFDERYSDKLFKVFQRLHNAEEFEGTGVGLALVERIISKHGGKIWAEGEVNKGAVFYFSLP